MKIDILINTRSQHQNGMKHHSLINNSLPTPRKHEKPEPYYHHQKPKQHETP
jgi:hypothetical protein